MVTAAAAAPIKVAAVSMKQILTRKLLIQQKIKDLENANEPNYQFISTQSPQASSESSYDIDRTVDLRFDALSGETTEVTKIVMIFQI